MTEKFYLGIDVGSASARAGIFTPDGRLLGTASQTISIRRPAPEYAEQSSSEIWAACCASARNALGEAGVAADAIAAIGFDATCSLVAQDGNGTPLSIAIDGALDRDIVMWMDHRAHREAEEINATGNKILQRTGASLEDIDATVRDGLSLRWAFMGPFETIDLNAPGRGSPIMRLAQFKQVHGLTKSPDK